MKKYIDLLTIGNLTPDVLKVLAPLRARYNIVSCRSMASTELVNSSKLILQEDHMKVKINNDEINLAYIEDYLENAICTTPLKELDNYYSIAINKSNAKNFINLANNFGISQNNSVCLLVLPRSEFESVEKLPKHVKEFIDKHSTFIEIIQSDYNYDYSRLIPAVRYMLEHNLDDKNLIQLNADIDYSVYAIYKMNRLLNETDNFTITNAISPDSLFNTAILSNSFTAVKPKYFTSMLWEGLRNSVIENSSANYWHTFILWVTNVCMGNYYCKFEDVPFDTAVDETLALRMKAFYNELARIGINKLLTLEEQL